MHAVELTPPLESMYRLPKRYPLPESWCSPELFSETARVGTAPIHLAGFVSRRADGELATGSAAAVDEAPVERAYFELVERIAVLDAQRQCDVARPIYDAARREVGGISSQELFPASPTPNIWRFSVSNGVAVHETWADACRSALLELIERDCLLRSWYGQVQLARLAVTPSVPPAIACRYDCRLYAVQAASTATVAAMFGFPHADNDPVVYGFGAGVDQLAAVRRATTECIQRLGFLWGEEVPREMPAFAPTADYHQEYYLRPQARHQLEGWLAGEHQGQCAIGELPRGVEVSFADLTPVCLRGNLFVAKAILPGSLPLTFGARHPAVAEPVPSSLQVHPLC